MKKYLIILVFLTSCSSEKLSNEIAFSQISESIQNCKVKFKNVEYSYNSVFKNYVATGKDLEIKGLAKFQFKKGQNYSASTASIYPTQKGKDKYLADNGKYIMTEITNLKIKGISQTDENSAIVLFSYEVKPTPFYGTLDKSVQRDMCQKLGYKEEEIKFNKFDTGWKMERKKTKEEKLMEILNQ